MAAEVDAALRQKRCLAIEAGTGVGKSFAYLVPAILYAVEDQVLAYRPDAGFDPSDLDAPSDASDAQPYSDAEVDVDYVPFSSRRVVVSTHTISLQEQLIQKDVPFLNSVLPFEFSSALAKGRSNYVCQRRFSAAKKSAETGTLFSKDRTVEFERLDKWLMTTRDGSKSEIPFRVEVDVWEEICCEQGNCLGKKCRYREACFYQRARRRLDSAQLIVANHALLFSDLAVRGSGGAILPNYDVLVVDEAHTIEQVAADCLGFELSERSVEFFLKRLYNQDGSKGIIAQESGDVANPNRMLFELAAERAIDCQYRAEEFFNELKEWIDARPGSNGRVFETGVGSGGLTEGLRALKIALRNASDSLKEESRRLEYKSALARVEALIDGIDGWREQRFQDSVYWLESFVSKRNHRRVLMRAAPVDVAPILREQLFNVVPSVIAASATLTTGAATSPRAENDDHAEIPIGPIALSPDDETDATRRAFQFFRERVGMTGAAARALGSPYNYREQMTLTLVKGLELSEDDPRVRGLDYRARAEVNERRMIAALLDYVDETDGGAFALFTNARQMKRAATALAPEFARRNYPFYSQGEGTSRALMVERFKESERSVLFGVDSFWQGVDVPGAALRNVIIVKFPFLAPEQPLVEARLEAIRERGGNDFREYLLPNAVLKFKQGIGRLIRTKSDFGQAVVLDERATSRSYGRDFLAALPDCKLRCDVFD